MKKVLLIAAAVLLSLQAYSATLEEEVAAKGEEGWKSILAQHDKDGSYTEFRSAGFIVSKFNNFKDKVMLFPELNFSDFVVDKDGNKYYYYGNPKNFDMYVIKYDERLTDKFRHYSYVIGGLSDEKWEVLGVIKDAYSWWGDVVRMDIVAMRAKGKAAAYINDKGEVVFFGDDLLEKELAKKQKDSDKDVPKNLKAIPKGLAPLTVAKLFFYVSSVEKNQDVWVELLSKDTKSSDAKQNSFWRNLTTKNRTYFYVRTDKDEAAEKKYFFQIAENGKNLGDPKPIIVINEGGEWRVDSANP